MAFRRQEREETLPIQYLSAYLSALWNSWLTIWSGLVGVVLTVLGAYLPPDRLRLAIWAAAILCFVLALFGVWLSEYKRVLAMTCGRLEISPDLGIGVWRHPEPTYLVLTVKNLSQVAAKDCRVEVRKITKKVDPVDGKEWERQEMPHDLQLAWTPFKPNEPVRTFADRTQFDFGFIAWENLRGTYFPFFRPRFLHNVERIGILRPGQTFRYYLQVTGEIVRLDKYAVREFSWDGNVKLDSESIPIKENLRQHIRFCLVDFEQAESETI